MRIPRKKKKLIPKGTPYCYIPTSSFGDMGDGEWGYTIKTCPFYKGVKVMDIPVSKRPHWMDDEYIQEFGDEFVGWCKLVKCEIDDQCKSCGYGY
tara:strand:- start:1225 stop:1509 length:285 start_codon:yes stop_codon:yes gene_type:complete